MKGPREVISLSRGREWRGQTSHSLVRLEESDSRHTAKFRAAVQNRNLEDEEISD
jgi:hypothetical protein